MNIVVRNHREVKMMDKKTLDVIINGKVYTVSGSEDEAYLNRVAAYINGRLQEMKTQQGFLKQPQDTQNVMIALNLADDYFKLKEEYSQLQELVARQNKDLYALKHEVVAMKVKLEEMEKKDKNQ